MTTLLAPASLPWLLAHELRLKLRGRTRGLSGPVLLTLIMMVPIMVGIALAWRWQHLPAVPEAALGQITAVLALMTVVMLASAYGHVLRTLRDTGELELLLAAPLPRHRVLAARAVAIQVTVAVPAVALSLPFLLASAALGHAGWLAAVPVLLALAMVATATAFVLADGLQRLLGRRRAQAVAQVLGVALGAVTFLGAQTVNFAPHWFQAAMAFIAQPPPAPFDIPARAALGGPLPLLAMVAVATLAGAVAARRAAAALSDRPEAFGPVTAGGRVRFGLGPRRTMVMKELRLIGRDPELISQIGQQLVFMVPVMALVFTGGGITPERLASAAVFLAGALTSNLAWLMVAAEDAPDLVRAAPLPHGTLVRAKLVAAVLPAMGLVGVLAIAVAPSDPVAAVVVLPMALVAGLATAAMQIWLAKPQQRRRFRQRHRSSWLLAVGEFVALGCWALACRMLLAESLWALLPAAVSAAIVGGVYLARQR